jgi:hypothetical protein
MDQVCLTLKSSPRGRKRFLEIASAVGGIWTCARRLRVAQYRVDECAELKSLMGRPAVEHLQDLTPQFLRLQSQDEFGVGEKISEVHRANQCVIKDIITYSATHKEPPGIGRLGRDSQAHRAMPSATALPHKAAATVGGRHLSNGPRPASRAAKTGSWRF